MILFLTIKGLSWPWSYGSWSYNYLCNQFLSPLMLWVRISIRVRCTTLCDKVCLWLATGRWFSPGPPQYNWNIGESGAKAPSNKQATLDNQYSQWMLPSRVECARFDHNHFKSNFEIDMCCFSSNHTTLQSKKSARLARNQVQ